MKTNIHKNAETLRQIFSADDNKFNSTFTTKLWQESCRTFRSADELPHLPLVFNISYKEKLSFK